MLNVRFSDPPKFFKFVLIPTSVVGSTRSIPAEVGTTIPNIPIKSASPREYPQEMSITAGTKLKPREPGNTSSLVQEYLPELRSEEPLE